MMRGVAMLTLLAAGLVSCGGEDTVGRAELDAALERARREGKLVLLDFYGDHCPPCARMKKETWPAPEVREQLERFVFLEIDTSRSAELVRRFGVRVIPTIIVLDTDGRMRKSLIGFRSAAEMAAELAAQRPVSGTRRDT